MTPVTVTNPTRGSCRSFEIASLHRFNDDVREVATGYDCGIVLQNYADVKEGDIMEAYTTRQVERELA